jgi:hypothetical protein
MKNIIFAASLLVISASALATDVGVSISVNQPGLYGRVDLGDAPRPRLIYTQPVIVQRPVQYVEQEPVYLHVPPGHAKKWSKHCGQYNACGQRVYFVQDSWYEKQYVPHQRQKHGDHDRRDHDRNDRDDHDEKHDNRGGNGHGNGRG